jgi:predicted enzyme related to lactoylglutathione lyase
VSRRTSNRSKLPEVGPNGLPPTPDGLIVGLAYLYVGSKDVDADLGFYRDSLGGELAWRFHAFEADVAGVRLGEGPLLLLADHRPAPSVLPIFAVTDLDATEERLKTAGWAQTATRVEVPDGPALVLRDPSGNEIALLHRVRPDAMPSSYRDPDNPHAVED